MRFTKPLYLLFWLCFIFASTAQELPPVLNFTPEQYNAENQNWDITQGEDKLIYAANNSGLLEYDGAKWRLYPTSNKTIMRSVATQGDLIYTGAYMEFGYWERGSNGLLQYMSLSDKLEEPLIEDEQFWNIILVDNLILFQSLDRIYSYNTETSNFQIIDSESAIVRSFLVGKSVYFQQEGLGLYQLQNGQPVLISDALPFSDYLLVALFSRDNTLMAVTQKHGIFLLKPNGEMSSWNYEAQDAIANETVYAALQLSDQTLLLGTISNGLYHLDAAGKIKYQIDQISGLSNNTVLSLWEDQEAHVWLGLDNGISVVNSNSAFRVYTDYDGSLGAVYAAKKHKGYLYVGTNQGLFYKKDAAASEEYQLIPDTKGQVWSLNVLGDALICGHHEGTFRVEENRVIPIANIAGTWDVHQMNDTLAIQGNYSGLYILERKETGWQLRNKLEGFDISSRYFAFSGPQTLYVSHEYKGVFKLNIDDSFRTITESRLLKQLPKGAKSSIFKYNNEVLYAYEEGIFRLNKSAQVFEKDSLLSHTFLESGGYSSGKLTYDTGNNRLWAFNEQEVLYFEPGILADQLKVRRIALPAKTRKDIPGFENITYLDSNTYLLGNATGYIILDTEKLSDEKYFIKLRTIKNGSREGELVTLDQTTAEAFHYKQNTFAFDFSVAEYEKFRAVVYQYRLKGLYEEWTNWSTSATASFENLPPGTYTFEARARIGDQLSENTLQYSFTVARPWYFSVVAIIIYGVLLVLIFIGIQVVNRKFYKRQKERLIEINQRKLEVATYENERRIMKLENEKLQQDVESKNRELAASTMSIVKKNELLNAIKKELDSDTQENELKSVIKIIDKNLNPKKDWEFFREAFNNADKDFLKKIKELHPKLTPNDLKLCAYLRLNLSSKEIAPLLNISVRSVEIKRYRLRKKMELEHEESLVEYILSI